MVNSRLALGTAQMGLFYGINNDRGQIQLSEAEEILNWCYKNGVKYLDTSSAYGDSETRLGLISEKENYNFEIISKLNRCEPDEVENNINISFHNLHHNRLYAYLCHQFEFFLESPKIWDYFLSLKNEGRVKKIGFSLYNPSQLEWLFEKKVFFDIIQIPFNLFDQRFAGLLSRCESEGVEVHARSIFLQGLFFKKVDTLPHNFNCVVPKLRKITTYSEELNMSLEHMLMLYVANNKHIQKLVIGVDSLENLKSNLSVNDFLDVAIDFDYLNSFKEDNLQVILPINWKI